MWKPHQCKCIWHYKYLYINFSPYKFQKNKSIEYNIVLHQIKLCMKVFFFSLFVSKQVFCKALNYALVLTQDLAGAHKTVCRQAEIYMNKHKYTLTGWWAPARFLDSCGEPYSRETCFLTSDATVLWETQKGTFIIFSWFHTITSGAHMQCPNITKMIGMTTNQTQTAWWVHIRYSGQSQQLLRWRQSNSECLKRCWAADRKQAGHHSSANLGTKSKWEALMLKKTQ